MRQWIYVLRFLCMLEYAVNPWFRISPMYAPLFEGSVTSTYGDTTAPSTVGDLQAEDAPWYSTGESGAADGLAGGAVMVQEEEGCERGNPACTGGAVWVP